MRCNPSYWLLGLAPIALLSWVAVQFERGSIEADLSIRAADALKRVGLSWAVPVMDGRDAIVTGHAMEDRDGFRALDQVSKVWGVRIANDQSGLVQRVDRFVWSAETNGDQRLSLTGYVPSENARRDLIEAARSAFPGRSINDGMQLARGTIDRDAWLDGAVFSLRNLAQLKRGSAQLASLDLSMTGEAATTKSYRDVRSALKDRRPPGVKLALERITPPVVNPYVWTVKRSGGEVTFSGFVPSDEVRAQIASRAKSLYVKQQLSDSTEFASGEPDNWSKAVSVSLDQLALLNSGGAALRGRELTFTGEAPDEQTATAVRRTLKLDVPENFKIIEQIRFPRPELTAPQSGYLMGVVNSGTALDVIGMVPSEAARSALIDAVKARFPGRPVNDKTQVVPGAPEGWQQCVVAGLAALPKLKTGKSMLTDRRLAVSGQTDDYSVAQSIPIDIKAAAGQTCDATTDIVFSGQMKTDLTWRAARETNGMVTLSGEAPDDASRSKIVEIAQQIYAGSSVTDDMKVVGAAAEPWLSITRTGLEQLARLKRGEAALATKTLTVKGSTDSEQVVNDVRSALRNGLPYGYKGVDEIAVMSVEEKAADSCQSLMRQATAKGTINFERAKADLTADSTATLRELAEIANECPSFRIEIEGHTDAEGTDERNQRLSDRRAKAVADFLSRNGVESKRLSTVGYGATRPIADNATADGRARNRRIEFTVKVN